MTTDPIKYLNKVLTGKNSRIDGVKLTPGARILFVHEVEKLDNGIYTVTYEPPPNGVDKLDGIL